MPVAVPFLLLASAISFGLGLVLPIVRFERLWVFEDTPSLIEVVWTLWTDGAIWLAFVVAAFSIVFPLVKLGSTFAAAYANVAPPTWAATLSKWSMMDVLLVALVVLAAKTSGLADAVAQPGLWFYAISAVSGFVAALMVARGARDGIDQARNAETGT